MASDSIEKLKEVLECALRCGVHIGPIRIQLIDDRSNHDQENNKEFDAIDDRGTTVVSLDDVNVVINSNDDHDNREDIHTNTSQYRAHTVVSTVEDMTTADHHHHHSPAREGVVIVPLYSWYHKSWDVEPSVNDAQYLAVEKAVPFNRRWGDFSLCSWPTDVISHEDFINNVETNTILAEAFAKLNERFLYPPDIPHVSDDDQDGNDHHHSDHHDLDESYNEIIEQSSSSSLSSTDTPTTLRSSALHNTHQSYTETTATTKHHVDCRPPIFRTPLAHPDDFIISFSHFLPRIECCPEKRFLIDPALSTVIGSDPLGAQVTRLQPNIHLFGHTHIPMG